MGMYLDFILAQENLQYEGVDNNGKVICGWNIANIGDSTSQVWLGEAFLSQFFTVWDIDEQKVGFGVSAWQQPDWNGPWLNMYMMPMPVPSGGGVSTLAVVLIVSGSVVIVGVIAVVVVTQMKKKKAQETQDDEK